MEREAVLWVVRLTSGEARLADRLAFRKWRARSPEHRAAAADALRLWVGVGRALPARHRVRAAPVRYWPVLAMAAAVLLLTCAGFYGFNTWRYDQVTGSGEQRSVALADGTQVEMGGATALSVDYQGAERRVVLGRGEAYFDVVHDAGRPFMVEAGGGRVRVLGTAFSVRRDDEGVLVTVVRGRVEVNDGAASVVLLPAQQLRYQAGRHQAVAAVDPQRALAWRQRLMFVDGEPLGQVAEELNRYYSGRIVVMSAAAQQRHLNAMIQLDHIDGWLYTLNGSQALTVKQAGPLVMVY